MAGPVQAVPTKRKKPFDNAYQEDRAAKEKFIPACKMLSLVKDY
jgi:hypothetical protein